ncbi:cytochrome c oxidase subunit 2, partial [Nitrosospira sp. Nsp1]
MGPVKGRKILELLARTVFSNQVGGDMSSKAAATIVGIVATALYSGLGMAAAADPYQLNLPEPQTPIAQQIYDLHTLVLWICLVIFV